MSKSVEQQKETSALQPGNMAPYFTLRTSSDQSISLDQFKGNPVILLFYPADFSPVCGDEVSLYNEILPEFKTFKAEVIGISVDNVWCHLAFSKHKKLRFPLLSDFQPKGNVAEKYGVYRKDDGVAERALFLVDKDGIIRYSDVSPIGVNPGVDGILKALEALPQDQRQQDGNNKK